MDITFLLETDKLNDNTIFNKYYNRMSMYRKAKIDRLMQRKDKNLSLAVGIIIDHYLQSLDLSENKMNYSTTPAGKPFFYEYKHIHFNASHSDNVAICTFSDTEIGCDIQHIEKARENVAKRFFTQQEYNYIFSDTENNKITADKRFARIWSIKEAYLKLLGTGLSGGLASFDILTENGNIQIKDNIYIKEYSFKDYQIAICSNKIISNDELQILYI